MTMTNNLKLGTAQYTYLLDCSLEESLRKIEDLGFKYVELMTVPPHCWPPALSRKDRENLRNTMERLGLELIALNPTFLDLNLASLNPGIREESVRQIEDQISLAHDLGAKLAVIILGKRHPLIAPPIEEVWERYAREGVLRCVEHAEKKGVIFGLEQSPNLFVENTERMLWVLNEVKSPALKIVFDVANASMVEPIEAALDRVKDHLVHVHLSDTDGKKWTHSPVGLGTIDFGEVAAKLKEIGFGGVSVLEVTYPRDPQWAIASSIERLIPLGWKV